MNEDELMNEGKDTEKEKTRKTKNTLQKVFLGVVGKVRQCFWPLNEVLSCLVVVA